MKRLTLQGAIWNVLVAECGANEDQRADFLYHFPACVEYRFQGALGFGGKVYANGRRVWVSCYQEDETPERLTMIERANDEIAWLLKHGYKFFDVLSVSGKGE